MSKNAISPGYDNLMEPPEDSFDDFSEDYLPQYPDDESQEEDPFYDEVIEDWPKPPWEERPPLGVLSRGPVWSCCPEIVYMNHVDRLQGILCVLSLAECEELVEFLCGLDHVCIKPDCDILTRDYFRYELIGVALARRDYALAQRQRALLDDPSLVEDEWFDPLPPPRPRARQSKKKT